jgi:hypothetical protein
VGVHDLRLARWLLPGPSPQGDFRTADTTGVDVGPLNVTEFEGEQIVAEEYINGLIVAGERYRFTEDGFSYKGRTATAAYTRLMTADFLP